MITKSRNISLSSPLHRPDTHYLDELDNMALGVATGRRAWIGPGQVVNALPLDHLLEWARGGR